MGCPRPGKKSSWLLIIYLKLCWEMGEHKFHSLHVDYISANSLGDQIGGMLSGRQGC